MRVGLKHERWGCGVFAGCATCTASALGSFPVRAQEAVLEGHASGVGLKFNAGGVVSLQAVLHAQLLPWAPFPVRAQEAVLEGHAGGFGL